MGTNELQDEKLAFFLHLLEVFVCEFLIFRVMFTGLEANVVGTIGDLGR